MKRALSDERSNSAAKVLHEVVKRTAAIVICQVQSAALAKEAAEAGADILVAQGTEAGGHGATRGLFTLIPEILDALGGRTPVVAAGGIADGRGLAAALMLGATGVLMGTRFYASQEAAGAQGAKERISQSDWRRHAAQHRFRYF